VIMKYFLIVQIFLLSTINNRGWHYKIDFDDHIFVNIFNTLSTILYNVKKKKQCYSRGCIHNKRNRKHQGLSVL